MPTTKTQTTKRLLHYEDCAHAIDQLFHSALKKEGRDSFWKFMQSARNFSNLSVYNAMLVKLQRPGAVMVGSRAGVALADTFSPMPFPSSFSGLSGLSSFSLMLAILKACP